MWSQPTASATPGNLMEMQILKPHLLNQKLWERNPATGMLTNPPGHSDDR